MSTSSDLKADKPSRVQRFYGFFGFKKGYNAILAFLTLGYVLGFSASRLQYFRYHDIFCGSTPGNSAAPGECYFYLQDPYKIGMMIHLFCILPAGILVVLQFIPIIRYKAMILHRINGYLVILLSTVASAGAIIVTPHAFGGDMATRTIVGVMVISTTASYIIAWINIKKLQIDQHRAWMMRAWVYFASIISIRFIMIISARIISATGGFSVGRPCAQIEFLLGTNKTQALYPGCEAYFNGTADNAKVLVNADFTSNNAMEVGASMGMSFGSAGWIALWLHAIAVEVYLRLTPAESQRLKEVSYQRQMERGYKNPGTAGLTAERLGDANPYMYMPASQRGDRDEKDF